MMNIIFLFNGVEINRIFCCRQGVINPCRIGEDGRPEPVEHIMELQQELPRQQVSGGTRIEEVDDWGNVLY
jgi:hypothetical protein